jgi:hypothetical protein
MSFDAVLATSWFKYGVLPSITTGLALLMKFNSRPDVISFELEDWAVGFDLCQVSFFAILTDGVADAVRSIATTGITDAAKDALKNRLETLPWVLCGMLIILILVSIVVRKAGWTKPAGVPQPKLNRLGLILPLIIGVVYVIGAIMWMGGNGG